MENTNHNITLEQEFNNRLFIHKISILGGLLMKSYMLEKEQEKGALLPPHIIEKEADEYSNKIIQNAMEHGVLDQLYEIAYEKFKNILPDNLKLL